MEPYKGYEGTGTGHQTASKGPSKAQVETSGGLRLSSGHLIRVPPCTAGHVHIPRQNTGAQVLVLMASFLVRNISRNCQETSVPWSGPAFPAIN